MKGSTHIVGGIAFGCFAFNNIDILNVNINDGKTLLLVSLGLTIGALIPDIDHKNSTISNKVKPIGNIISRIFKHRGFTHSVLGSIVMTILFGWLFSLAGMNKAFNIVLTKSIYIGIISHILLDMLTPSGVDLLYPYNRRYNIASFKMGGIGELILVILFIGVAYYNVYYII